MLYYINKYIFDSRYNEYFEKDLGDKTANDKIKAYYYEDDELIHWNTYYYKRYK